MKKGTKKSKKSRSIIYLLLFIALLFIFSISIVVFFKPGTNSNVKADDVYLEATQLNVTVKDLLSVTDDFGKTIADDNGGAFGYVDIEIINEVDEDRNYQLFVREVELDQPRISPAFVKLYLTDLKDEAMPNFDDIVVPTYNSLRYLEDLGSSKLVLSGTIGPKKHINVRLRTWISDSFISHMGENSFSYDIGVRAID